jgi:hypothetical protein
MANSIHSAILTSGGSGGIMDVLSTSKIVSWDRRALRKRKK